jgi:F0F1-type ATP synthase membrane subunit b/b'
MFSLIKLIIWLAGVLVIAYFALPYFGYEVNTNYFNERKAACQEKLTQCRKDLIQSGIQGAKDKCDFQCVDPKILINKKQEASTK